MRLLLINPNTSEHITARMAVSARLALRPRESLTALTASSGPAVVRTASQLAEAELGAVAMADAHAGAHDAIVLAISLDGAVRKLRERHPALPIVGMTEAALFSACLRAERVGLLTIGSAMLPLYRARVAEIGLAVRVSGYEAPDLPAAFVPASEVVDEQVGFELAAATDRLRAGGCGAIVLAGAVLCGYADLLARRCSLPVFDGVSAAVGHARLLMQLSAPPDSDQPAPAA